MSQGWDKFEPSPIEYLHGKAMEKFHEFRKAKTEFSNIEIDGMDFTSIIADAKILTYKKYIHMNLDKAVPKENFNHKIVEFKSDEINEVIDLLKSAKSWAQTGIREDDFYTSLNQVILKLGGEI